MFTFPNMVRASRLIRKLGLPPDALNAGELVRHAWPGAVGKTVAAHARAVDMVRSRLVVEVEDNVWQRQLFSLAGQILRNLEKQLGPGLVDDLEFRIVPPRRGPQRAAFSTARGDEADGISDPVLRHIYRASRKKALA
ncbi:MAG: DUF721 domain-containing protein [Acidobacteria bacterium]|nr:DUF721 domain-containing protein [Acidobacteriota bacterium]